VQGHTDAVGKVAKIDAERAGSLRVWIRPPKRFLDEIVAKGSVAVDGVSLPVAAVLTARFSVALIPVTLANTTLADLRPEQRVSLESDLFVKSARDLWQSARLVASSSLAALPWAGELTGPSGVVKCAAYLAAGAGVLIYDPDREGEADVVFAGARLRPESMAFLLTRVCGHTDRLGSGRRAHCVAGRRLRTGDNPNPAVAGNRGDETSPPADHAGGRAPRRRLDPHRNRRALPR